MKHAQTLDLDGTPVERSDMELVELTRSGNKDAFGELWRRHYHAAIRAARAISRNHDPEDMAQEAFTNIYHSICQNSGPNDVFRAYLYSVLRSVSMKWSRNENSNFSLDDILVGEEPFYSFEGQVIADSITARAFATLKSEWRAVLWYLDVEGMKPKDVAPMLGLSANTTSALAYRAREALRSAWLQAHLNSDNADDKCKWSVERLGSYNRDTLPARQRSKLQDHLDTCLKCSILVNEIDQISKNLGVFLLPVLLGPAAFSYLDTISEGDYTEGPVPPNPVAEAMAGSSKIVLGVLTSAVTASGLIAASIFMFSSTPTDSNVAAPAPTISTSPAKAQPSMAAAAAATAFERPTTADTVPVITTQRPPSVVSISDMDVMVDLDTEVTPNIDTQPSAAAPSAPTVPTTAAPNAPATDAPTPSPGATPAPTAPAPMPTATPSPTPAPSVPAPPAPRPTITQPPVATPTPTPTPTAPAAPSELAAPSIDSVTEQGLLLPLLHGSGVPGATVTVLSDGESVGSALADSSGSWSVVPDMTLASGASVSFMAYQELDGLVSATSSASAPVSLATPEVLSIEYTNGAGNVSLSGPAGSTVEVIIDGNPTGNLHVMDGRAAVRRLPALSPGQHSLVVRFVDQGSTLHGAGLYLEFDVPPTGRVVPPDPTDPPRPA